MTKGRHPEIANVEASAVVLVDVQERLWPHIHGSEALLRPLQTILLAAERLSIPVLHTEQYPKGLGGTIAALNASRFGAPIEKETFSCFGAEAFVSALAKTERRQLIILGIEAHVCVLQTALDALSYGYEVFLPVDAVGSRNPTHREFAIARMAKARAIACVSESLIFEWLEHCKHPHFKELQGHLK